MSAMLRFVSGILLLAFATPLFAADDLAAIGARVARPELLRGQFAQNKQVEGFRQPLRSSGQFVLARGRGVLWQTERPFPSRLTVTPNRITAESGGRERRVDAATEPALRAINRVLFDLLAGEIARLADDFEITIGKRDASGWQLALTPRPGPFAQVFASIELEGDRQVSRVLLAEHNGDRTEIRFSAQTDAPPLTPDEDARLVD